VTTISKHTTNDSPHHLAEFAVAGRPCAGCAERRRVGWRVGNVFIFGEMEIMNESHNHAGWVVTMASAAVSLSGINTVVQILAGLVAIAVGVVTFIYTQEKRRKLRAKKFLREPDTDI
jgi:hypothetical protein